MAWDDLGSLLAEYKSFKSQFPGNSLSKDDFVKLASQSSWGKGKDKDSLEQLFRAFDSNKSNSLDFKEFLLGTVMCTAKNITPEDKLKFYFDALDIDNNGTLSKDEIESAFTFILQSKKKSLPTGTPQNLSAEVFNLVDSNRDDKITSKELADFYHNSSKKFHELGLGIVFDIAEK